MDTTEAEPERVALAEEHKGSSEHNGSSVHEEKRHPSHEELRRPDSDIETAREDVDQHPRMTFKRFMAIFSLGCLLAAAQIPIYLIGGALCKSFLDIY